MVDAETFSRETMVFPCEDSTTAIGVGFIFFLPFMDGKQWGVSGK